MLLTVPFAFLEPLTGYRLFVALMALLQAAALLWMLYELRPGGRVGPLAGALAVMALLVSSPLLATLALGQMYPVLTLGLVAAWAWDRRDREAASGVALGLLVALKPSLAPLLLWPLVRRRWGALGVAMAAGAAATLAGAIVVGRGATMGWVDLMLGTTANPYWDNASLPAAAARLFTEHEFGESVAMLPGMVSVFGLGGSRWSSLPRTARGAGPSGRCGRWRPRRSSPRPSPGTTTSCCSRRGCCCSWGAGGRASRLS